MVKYKKEKDTHTTTRVTLRQIKTKQGSKAEEEKKRDRDHYWSLHVTPIKRYEDTDLNSHSTTIKSFIVEIENC